MCAALSSGSGVRTPRRSSYAGFRGYVKTIGTGERGRRALTFDEAYDAVRAIMAGEVTGAQAGAFLIAMRIKGESPEELAGMTVALRERAATLVPRTDRPLVCSGGAYDGCVDAPALSLAAAFVAAGAGAGIVVHCGDTLGPKYGVTAADVAEALGAPARPSAAEAESTLERSGVALVNAAALLDGWPEASALRNEIGLRGPLHSAEKLIDWFGAKRFVVGYTHAQYGALLAGALSHLGAELSYTIRGIEGSDIARPGRPVVHVNGEPLEMPHQLGDRLPDGPGAQAAAERTRAVVGGRADRITATTVVLSAAVRLHAAGLAPTILRGVSMARSAIANGQARAVLEAFAA